MSRKNIQCEENNKEVGVWKTRVDERDQWTNFKSIDDEDLEGWIIEEEKNDKSSSLDAKRGYCWEVWIDEMKG